MQRDIERHTKAGFRPQQLLGALFIAMVAITLCAAVMWAEYNVPQVGPWTRTAPVPAALIGPRAAAYSDKLYVIGGRRPYQTGNPIISAMPQTDGIIGHWTAEAVTTTFPVTLSLHAVAQQGSNLYIIGGWDEKRRFANVWRAQLGSAFSCCTRLADFPLKIVLHEAVVAKGNLYVIGGVNENNVAQNTVYYLNPNGTSGQWTALPYGLPNPRFRHAVAVSGDQIFISGGYDGTNTHAQIYCATATTDGIADRWQRAQYLKQPTYYHQMVVQGNRLVISGGRNDEERFSDVYWYEIGNGCELSEVHDEDEPDLPLSLARHAAIVSGNFSYVIGGLHDDISQSQVYVQEWQTIVESNPGLQFIYLLNEPKGAIQPGQMITYRFTYRNGSARLENVRMSNLIPAPLQLSPVGVQQNAAIAAHHETTANGDLFIEWIFTEPLAPYQAGTIAYQVYLPQEADGSNTTITNTGVLAQWTYNGQAGEMQSLPVLNPSVSHYLPMLINDATGTDTNAVK